MDIYNLKINWTVSQKKIMVQSNYQNIPRTYCIAVPSEMARAVRVSTMQAHFMSWDTESGLRHHNSHWSSWRKLVWDLYGVLTHFVQMSVLYIILLTPLVNIQTFDVYLSNTFPLPVSFISNKIEVASWVDDLRCMILIYVVWYWPFTV